MFTVPNLKPEEILIYLRKSRTDDPALSVSETLAKHEQMLNEWCMRNLSEPEPVPESNRFREVVSGETIEARPEVQKVLRLIEQPRYKAVLIVEPQRLSRGDLEDIGRLTKIFRYTNTLVITLQGVFDLNDERDRDYFNRELMRGNDFLEYQKRIMGNGRVLSVENGNYIGSRAPYGYERTRIREGKHWAHTLEINPAEAENVRIIFDMYASGNGATAICTRLNQIGSKTKNGAQWTPPTIYSMLDNPIYIGMVKWQARRTVKTVENGEIVRHTPHRKDYPVYPGKHAPIIDTVLWEAVRARRTGRTIPRNNITYTLKNPLSGLIQCECGHYMIRRPYNGRCADRIQCPNMTYCKNASSTMDEMIEEVKRVLNGCIVDFRVKIELGAIADLAAHDAYCQKLRERLSALEEKEKSLWEKYVEDVMPKHIFNNLLEKNTADKAQVKEQLRIAETSAPQRIDYEERCRSFQAAMDALDDEKMSAEQQNEMLKRCFIRLRYHRPRGKRGHSTGNDHRGWEMEPIQLFAELNL
ncbi:MAG: recombinase family protein [Oscillospiraceae bacterium]